nr:uncharacterized protein LOC113713886 [Coffea arabica]
MDTLNMLSAQMSNVMKLLSRQGGVGPSSSNAHVACCFICGGEHDTNECVDSKQVQFVNNYNRNAQNNPYSNTYNLGWRNHPNFGWKDQGNQPRPANPPGFQSRQQQTETKPGWEIAVEKLAKVTSDRFERVEGRLDQLVGMYRNLEVQIGQIDNVINNRNPSELLSKTEVNPREHVNAITLRSGKMVEGPNSSNSSGEKDKEQAYGGVKPSQNDNVVINIDDPPQLNSNIPSYARFLKDIMSRKRKIVDNEMIALTEECASVSLMPLSITRRLGLQELKATNITLQLADRSITHPIGILENVLIRVKQSIISVDFVVLDIEEDVRMPIILGQPFLATARTIIDVEKGTMARTRRARIRTPTPSSSEEHTPSLHEESPEEESPSPEPPPRSRRKTASTSRDEPLPDYDTTRFTSLENQQ